MIDRLFDLLPEILFWGCITFLGLSILFFASKTDAILFGGPKKSWWFPIIGIYFPNLRDPVVFKKHFYATYEKLCSLYDDGFVDLSEWDYTYSNLRTASYKFRVRDMLIAIVHLKRAMAQVDSMECRREDNKPRCLPSKTSHDAPSLGE